MPTPSHPNPLASEKTLRDEFAMAALVTLGTMLSNMKDVKVAHGGVLNEQALANTAYGIADALLAERAKSQPEQPATPDDDGWIEWHGGECPVRGERVELRFRDGTTSAPSAAGLWSWSNRDHVDDIIAYRVQS